MFFVRQQNNQCGLHAIQNLFKSASITREDLHTACVNIHKETGDMVENHESFGGDWSVAAVICAIQKRGYTVERAVKSSEGREWVVSDLESLLKDPLFRGVLIHQNRHFTCIRPEKVDNEHHLYYVDSQSDGPIRISPRLAIRRCLAMAYAWEPFVVHGEEMEYVPPCETPLSLYQDVSCSGTNKEFKRGANEFKPSVDFLQEWDKFSSKKT